MDNRSQHKVGAAFAFVFAALAGFVIAVIVVLNLHIVVGLEQGYAASPADVLDHSAILAAADVCLLVGGPTFGVLVWSRARGRSHHNVASRPGQ
jgi:hypothetical protein